MRMDCDNPRPYLSRSFRRISRSLWVSSTVVRRAVSLPFPLLLWCVFACRDMAPPACFALMHIKIVDRLLLPTFRTDNMRSSVVFPARRPHTAAFACATKPDSGGCVADVQAKEKSLGGIK